MNLETCTTWHRVNGKGKSSLSVQILQHCPPFYSYPSMKALHHSIYAFPFSAGHPVCSQRLHSVLVLYSQWGWIFFIGDQTDAAECPRAVLHQVYDTHTHARTHLCSMLNSFIISFCNWLDAKSFTRSKEVDWQPYFTTRLVDDFATHLRVFRKAQDRLADREDKQSKLALTFDPRSHTE